MDNKWGKCRARFPRPLYKESYVDNATGTLLIKKLEPWINTFTPALTYLFRCNTDVTSLKSGTAIKAVTLYVSNYITKTALKTHVVFDSIRSIFEKHNEVLGGTESRHEKTRQIMTRIVNSLTAKMEIGSPMASLYLLGHPDHYTSHTFTPLYWQSYVYEVSKYWNEEKSDYESLHEKITLIKKGNKIIGLSTVYDYMHRPKCLETLNLYDFVSCCKREKNKQSSNQTSEQIGDAINVEIEVDQSGLDVDLEEKKENLESGLYTFLPSHPFADSHCIRFYSLKKKHSIPNFVGATLPRHDQGDCEYYCKTM
ncbi:hypothetical protein BDN72DRAFT_781395, partial [Pluteus cervinus]